MNDRPVLGANTNAVTSGRLRSKTIKSYPATQLPQDEFVRYYSRLMSAKKLHALGVVTFLWNSLEFNARDLCGVLNNIVKISTKKKIALMNNEFLSSLMIECAHESVFNDEEKEAIRNVAIGFRNLNTIRSQLVHSALICGDGIAINAGTRNNPIKTYRRIYIGHIREIVKQISDFNKETVDVAVNISLRFNPNPSLPTSI